MLKINRMTDYAILVLGLLHHRGDEQLTANDMAVYLQLNKTTIAKVIRALSQAGLIETSRGIHGGCQLAVDVSKITVASVHLHSLLYVTERIAAYTSLGVNH
jgi:DNA-binding IscR family transcriptional regulator